MRRRSCGASDERDLDAVTGVSGSGPAYVFYFLEALEQAAIELGLDADDARRLAYATFDGSVALARASSEPPATLARERHVEGRHDGARARRAGRRATCSRALHRRGQGRGARAPRELGDEIAR